MFDLKKYLKILIQPSVIAKMHTLRGRSRFRSLSSQEHKLMLLPSEGGAFPGESQTGIEKKRGTKHVESEVEENSKENFLWGGTRCSIFYIYL